MSRRITGTASIFSQYRGGAPGAPAAAGGPEAAPGEGAPAPTAEARGITEVVPAAAPAAAAPPAPSPSTTLSDYTDRLMKLIPAEVVTAYVGATALIASATKVPNSVPWIVFGVLLVITPFVYWRLTLDQHKQPAVGQTAASTIAFVVWVLALGGPFSQLSWYTPLYGGLLLIFYTTFVPLFLPPAKT